MDVESTGNPTGKRRWFVWAGLAIGAAIILLAILIASRRDSRLAEFEALDPATGEPLWSLTAETYRSPTIAGDRLVLAAGDRVWAVNPDGEVEWEKQLSQAGQPLAAGPAVYVTTRESDQRALVALDRATGAEKWRAAGYVAEAAGDLAVLRHDGRFVVVAGSSGSPLGEFSIGRRGDYAVGPGGVAIMKKSGKLRIIDPSGTKRTLAKGLPERTRIAVVTADTVIINHRNRYGTRTLLAYDIVDGEELWTTNDKSVGVVTQRDDTISVRLDGIDYDLDPRTGTLTPNGGWAQMGAGEVLIAKLATSGGSRLSDAAVRYLPTESGVVAVNRQTNEVLWNRPTEAPVAATEGIAMFRDSNRYELVDAQSGNTIVEIERKKSTTGVLGDGRALIAVGGDVLLIDGAGKTTKMADLKKRVRAVGLSADYAVVAESVNDGEGNLSRVIVFSVADGSTLLDRQFPGYAPRLDGNTIVASGSGETVAIGIATGDPVTYHAIDNVREPTGSGDLIVALNPERTELLWTREVQWNATIHGFGEAILVSAIPYPGD